MGKRERSKFFTRLLFVPLLGQSEREREVCVWTLENFAHTQLKKSRCCFPKFRFFCPGFFAIGKAIRKVYATLKLSPSLCFDAKKKKEVFVPISIADILGLTDDYSKWYHSLAKTWSKTCERGNRPIARTICYNSVRGETEVNKNDTFLSGSAEISQLWLHCLLIRTTVGQFPNPGEAILSCCR